MAASPAFNQVFFTSAPPEWALSTLALARAPGWTARPAGPTSVIWTHKYMSTPVLIVGVILLLLTLIGGLLLLVRSEESLIASAMSEGGRTKVIVTGTADSNMAAAVFTAVSSLPTVP
jgi:hypothetical protein